MTLLRGSIPLFWSQEASPLQTRPEIVLQRFDPLYAATAAHFTALVGKSKSQTLNPTP
jgi:hypothetical protein